MYHFIIMSITRIMLTVKTSAVRLRLPLDLCSRSSVVIPILLSSMHTRLCLLKLACIHDFYSTNLHMESDTLNPSLSFIFPWTCTSCTCLLHIRCFVRNTYNQNNQINNESHHTLLPLWRYITKSQTASHIIPTVNQRSKLQKQMTAVGSIFPTFLIGPPSFSRFVWTFYLCAGSYPISHICSTCIHFLHVHTCYKNNISCVQKNKHKNHNEYF